MLLLKILLLLIAGTTNVVLGLIILARGRKVNNISFAALAISMGGWALGIAAFMMTNEPSAAFRWAKVYYFFPLGIAASLIIFTLTFPNNKITKRLVALIVIGALALAMPLIVVHGFVTESLIYHTWGKEIVLNLTDYLLYAVYLLISFPISLYLMYSKSKKLAGLYAVQASFFYYGFLVASVFGVIFNLVLPGFGNYKLIWLGPLFTSFFMACIAISIMRHKMFDVRSVIARSLGYAASLAVLTGLYGFIVFGLAKLLFDLNISLQLQIFLSLATGLTGAFYEFFRRRFDKVTNRIFYQDAYDAQDLFDELNKVLVSTVDLDKLILQSAQILQRYLKTEYCIIGIKESDTQQMHIVGTQKPMFNIEDITAARKITPTIHRSIIHTDFLEDKYADFKEKLVRNNIALMARLSQNVRKTEEGLGYIIFGPKKSGSPYSNRDAQVIDTVANELILAIQNALRYEEIKNFTVTLQARVDEATRKLRRTNERLKELDEAKDDFVSMASHQLRTPLTSIKGYTSMVLEGDAGKINATQRKLLEQSFFSSQRMVYLIADLLNVSRLKTGKFLIESAPVNLAKVVEQEIGQLKETAAGRSLELTYTKPDIFPDLMLDETKTRQVIMNFVDNAIFYTPAGGHITVELLETPASVELRVTDDGIGVPKSEQPHLFTKFYRAGNARKARPDGTGLGLYMAKKVVVAEGGAIIFKTQEGKGSTFGFVFSKNKMPASVAKPTSSLLASKNSP